MTLAVVTDKIDTLAAAEAALEEAKSTGTDLTVLGIVSPRLHAPQPSFGERVRQYRLVSHNVGRVLALAREQGVAATSAVVLGRPLDAGLREAHARAASSLFIPRLSARLRGASTFVQRIDFASSETEQAAERLAA